MMSNRINETKNVTTENVFHFLPTSVLHHSKADVGFKTRLGRISDAVVNL